MRGIALAVAILLPLRALAAPCERAADIAAGEAAPCDGVLVPALRLDRLLDEHAECMQADLPLCRERVRLIEERLTIDAAEAQARLDAAEAQIADLAATLEEAASVEPPPPPWWEHPAFVATVSVVTTAAVAAGVYALSLELAK